ncbi:hypothetical protein BDZ89DRAFT_1056191 [Hymenopellis radicata]|nr:hypothetical protein BDZ89DRAFT_1056191 [Hymenopellis radicata]
MHEGLANPTESSSNPNPMDTNYVKDPASKRRGSAGHHHHHHHKDHDEREAARAYRETAGVIEGRPGIIESTNIDPLNEHSNDNDGWANVTRNTGTASPGLGGKAQSAADSAKQAMGTVKEVVYGK